MTKITSTGIMNISANSCLRIYGSLIKAVTDACATKNSKTNGQKYNKENNQISTSET